ncbi:ATP-binding protein [Streptomyces boncukensis]|uniref:histidine kinase n=1 Tax=Streptomyces boncukensis TaxID=2711219 RepID=A0A6G4X8L7_9ACTN|nr:ATP-binding protein [Streptomyces boncukensis]NGO73094.1 sensor histidine kinase [Streptomyces boncukensis]
MTQYIQDPAFWSLVAGVPAAAAVFIRQRRVIRGLRQEGEDLRRSVAAGEDGYADAVRRAELRAEEATKTVLKSAMRTLQGLAAEQQLGISRLQSKYGDSVILQDLLEIDHMNNQFGRRAQSIAVLCQGWLGRQRQPASVYNVVRSAQGRIRHFQRVEILSQADFAITSRAVEPVALALAELLDNATSYSSPETVVEINVRSVPKGICIVVDDAGVGMNEEERTRAGELLSGARSAGVADLGNPPQFGFPVIGALCERYGFTVTVDSTSPYGGVRAVVLLPDELLTGMPQSPPRPVAQPGPLPGPAEPQPMASTTTADGLPKRQRKRPMAIVQSDAAGPTGTAGAAGPAGAAGARQRSDAETASIMAAFQQGTQSGRSAPVDAARRPGPADGSKGPEVS